MSGIADAKEGKLLYHLTKISNFPSIVKYGLCSREKLSGGGIHLKILQMLK